MPIEQELQLKVTLEDEASPQLAQIRAALTGLGGTSGGGSGANVSRLVGGMSDVEKAFGNLARGMLGVGRQAVDLAKAIGPMPVALGTLAYQTMRASEASESWALQMVRVANSARMAGTSVGDFRSVVDSLGRAGVSAETASAMMIKFNQAYGELVRMGSARREHLLNMAGPEFVGNMARAIRMIGTLRTDVEKLEAIRALGERVFQKEMSESHDLALATYKRDQIYAALGAEELAMVDRAIVAHSEITQKNMNAEAKAMGDVHAAHIEEQQTRDRIWQILRGSTATWDIWLTKQVTWVEKILLDAMEKEESRTRGKSFGENFFYTPDFMRGAYGTNKNPLGSNLKPLGEAGNIGGEAVQKTGENTKELSRLTTNVQKILTDPKALMAVMPMAKGGVVRGPQRVLIGERGPEAVVSSQGTKVVDKPTITTLGTGGTETVVPLTTPKLGAFPDQTGRPLNYQAPLQMGGETFAAGSGNAKKTFPSLPYGTYALDPTSEGIGKTGRKIGAIAGLSDTGTGNVLQENDEIASRPRTGVELHPVGRKLDQLYTLGCIGVDEKQWPHFRDMYLAEAAKNGGKLYLTSTRDGISINGSGTPFNVETADPLKVKEQLDNHVAGMAEGGTVTSDDGYPDRGFHGRGGSSSGGGATGNIPGGAPYIAGDQVFENRNAAPSGPIQSAARDLRRYMRGAGTALIGGAKGTQGALPGARGVSSAEYAGIALSGSGLLDDFNKSPSVDAAEIMRRRGLPQIPPGGVHDQDRGPLDKMMGNELQVGTSGNIKIEHDNPPPGIMVEATGAAFEGGDRVTTATIYGAGESGGKQFPWFKHGRPVNPSSNVEDRRGEQHTESEQAATQAPAAASEAYFSRASAQPPPGSIGQRLGGDDVTSGAEAYAAARRQELLREDMYGGAGEAPTPQPFDPSVDADWRHPTPAQTERQRAGREKGRRFDETHPEFGAGGIRG